MLASKTSHRKGLRGTGKEKTYQKEKVPTGDSRGRCVGEGNNKSGRWGITGLARKKGIDEGKGNG